MPGTNNTIGQNWLLLRGLARESAHWGNFIQELQQAFPDANISVLDLPGTGQSYLDNSPKTISDITKQTRLQALNIGILNQPITILAVSLGGMVAWEWLKTYPNDINGACIINTSFSNLNPFYQRLRWQSYPQFLALITQQNLKKRERAILQLVSNKNDQDEVVSNEWANIQHQRPISFRNSFKQIVAAATYKPDLSKPNCPTLLLNSKNDKLVSSVCSEKIHQHYQLPIHYHPWAGHDLTLDDPKWVTTQLQDWILKS